MKRDTHYSLLIKTSNSGLRLFEYGEEMYLYETSIVKVDRIYISEPGLSNVIIARDEPVWAFAEDHTIIGKQYVQGEYITVPATFNLSPDEHYTRNKNDYLMVAGEIGNNTKFIKISLHSPKYVVLDLTLR